MWMRGGAALFALLCLGLAGCGQQADENAEEGIESATELAADQPVQVAAGPGALSLETEAVTLTDGQTVEFEIGYLTVPENRSKPERTIQIEVARVRRRASADPNTPPVFFLPGGPGFPGVHSMLGWDALPGIIDMFTSVTDLVIVSQRGIGSSEPALDCEADLNEVDLSSRAAQDALNALLVAQAETCRDRWLAADVDLPAYSVLEAAADVADVAAALDYEEISLWGVSFGSHWSMAIMRYHPELVARAVLGGLEGPDHTYDMPGGVLAGVRRMAMEAAESESLAAFTPDGGWLAAFKSLIGELDAAPVTVMVDGQEVFIDGEAIKDAVFGYTRGISSRAGMRSWPADMHRLLSGDYEAYARSMLGRGAQGLPPAAFFTLDCGSGITAEREAVLNADPGQSIVGNLASFYQDVCPVWNVDLGDEFRTGFETDIPTLLVHGTYDVNTPYSNAQELLPAFTNSVFVTIDGGSHSALQEALGADQAFLDTTLGFLVSGALEGFPARIELEPIEWSVPGAPADG